jgi:hypothetical protein
MLVWVTLITGLLVLAAGSVAVTRVDRRWRPRHQQCCRCREAWYGEGKLCDRCGARGHDWFGTASARVLPTHDWQGRLDTGPIPRVEVPRPREPLDRGVVPPQRGAEHR